VANSAEPIPPGDRAGLGNLARMWLVCARRCGGSLFRALFAEVEMDADGRYQGHRISQPGYLCLNCGSPAFDLGDVEAEMAEEAADDQAPTRIDVLCPACETRVSVLPHEECPNCGTPLAVG
jgi:DNA-directed RNA polymerase subunit RPC12/RpoP